MDLQKIRESLNIPEYTFTPNIQLTPCTSSDDIISYTINTLNFDNSKEFQIEVDNIIFNCLYQKPEIDTSHKLVVMLHGGKPLPRTIANKSYFCYQRTSWSAILGTHQLNIIDPSSKILKKLGIWFYILVLDQVKTLVSKALDTLNLANSDLIFWGGSAGGTASIILSQFFPGCTIVANNSQLDFGLANSSHTKNLLNAGINLADSPYKNKTNITDIIAKNTANTYILLCNIASTSDLRRIRNFARVFNIKLNYGVQIYNNIGIWLYNRVPAADRELNSAHRLQDTHTIAPAIYQFINIIKNKVTITTDLANLFKILTIYWDKE